MTEWENIPFVQKIKEEKAIINTLKKLHSGKGVSWIKLEDVAQGFGLETDTSCTSRKASEILTRLGFDVTVKKSDGHYYVPVTFDALDYLVKKYSRYKV